MSAVFIAKCVHSVSCMHFHFSYSTINSGKMDKLTFKACKYNVCSMLSQDPAQMPTTYQGFQTRMVYLDYITCLKYTILV